MTYQMRTDEVRPMVESQDLRDALALFTTGVTVLTTRAPIGPLGMTVNSFSAVSLDPPLVLWSLARSSNRTSAFEAADHFAVHVLSDSQKDLCMRFTKQGDAFDPDTSNVNEKGVPIINGCIARFDCRPHAVHEGGDHLIFVAHVDAVHLQKAAPLVYFDRAFGDFRC